MRQTARRLGVLSAFIALAPMLWLATRSKLVQGEEAVKSTATTADLTRSTGSPVCPGVDEGGGGLDDSDIGSFVRVPAGSYVKGAHAVYPEERGAQRLHVEGFLLQVTEVTNREFAKFVEDTAYVTHAEGGRGSAVFDPRHAAGRGPMRWWRLDEGATWRTPEGVGSTLEGRGRHPVVHVSLADARAYAAWAGARLLTEVEWEYAATLGLVEPGRLDSGAVGPKGEPRANIWSGKFPEHDTGIDGFAGRAPVGCFPATKIGAYDMMGNVWEWTDTSDRPGRHVIKGGSYLCAKTHCFRYRPSARQELEDDFSAGHIGIRLARSLPQTTEVEREGVNP